MAIRFACPQCQTPLKISRKYAGQRGKCPSCSHKLRVPELEIEDPGLASEGADNADVTMDPATDSSEEPGTDETPDRSTEDHGNQQADSDRTKSKARPFSAPLRQDAVNVPRWIVFAQGALLGTVATTFFIFGLMTGMIGRSPATEVVSSDMTELKGSVFSTVDNQRTPDMGAVVIVIPQDAELEERPDAKLVNPVDFKAFDNLAIEDIERVGGGVVRANADGAFSLSVKPNREYNVLVVSLSQSRSRNQEIQKDLRADIGGVLRPIEDVVGDRDFNWQKIQMTSKPLQLDVVIFPSRP